MGRRRRGRREVPEGEGDNRNHEEGWLVGAVDEDGVLVGRVPALVIRALLC